MRYITKNLPGGNLESRDRIISSRCRTSGSALTELAICMLPYSLIMLGIILLGQISIGKQEVFKSVNWAAPNPGMQDLKGDVEQHFFFGKGTPSFHEESPYEPEVDAKTEEPVLPYTASDIQAAATIEAIHVSQTTTVVNGEVVATVTVSRTKAGKSMEDAGMIDTSGITGKTSLNPEDVGDLSYDFDVDPTLSREIADTLTSWVKYSRAQAGYEYSLGKDMGMSNSLSMENDSDGQAAKFRDKFTLGGESDNDAFACQSVSPDKEGFRGYFVDDSVDMDAITNANFNSEDGNVDPSGMQEPFIKTGDEAVKCWDINFAP